MKNLKCIIGATIATPLILCAMFAIVILILFGIMYISTHLTGLMSIIPIILIIAFVLFWAVTIWKGLYNYCVEYHKIKAEMKPKWAEFQKLIKSQNESQNESQKGFQNEK